MIYDIYNILYIHTRLGDHLEHRKVDHLEHQITQDDDDDDGDDDDGCDDEDDDDDDVRLCTMMYDDA